MCESLLRRAWMVALVLLFSAAAAVGQVAPLPFQNPIAWGGPIQPPAGREVGREGQPQAVVVPGAVGETAAEGSSDTASQTPGDSSSQISGDTPNQDVAGSASINPPGVAVAANPDNTIYQMGTPFPLQLQPQGLKLGPFYLTDVSDSFFYAVNTSPGFPTQTYLGDSLQGNLVSTKQFNNGGILAVQARGQLSITQSQPFFNTGIVATYSDQLTEHLSLSGSAQLTYFQNSILANPQYLLSYQNSGIVQQSLYFLQSSYSAYESNYLSLSYQLGERTQISLTPIVGATFQYLQGGWSNVHQFGGGVAVTRILTPDISVSGFYNLSYAVTSGVASSSPNWVSQNLGLSLQGVFLRYRGWSLGGSVSASTQTYGGSYTVTPTGSLRLMKSFGQSSISAAYTRTEASYVLVSSGYFDQADIGYHRKLGQNANLSVGVGEYRTSYTAYRQTGTRAGGSVDYMFSPRLSLNAGYNYAHQNGTLPSNLAPFVENVSYFSIGLKWLLGSRSGL
jgi:hypothetical protein